MLMEQRLKEILGQLLEVDPLQLPVDADMGEQGVDSLIGLRFARKIEELTGSEVELEWLLDHPTIAQLARFLEQRVPAAAPTL